DLSDPVPAPVECAGVDQLVFRLQTRAGPVPVNKVFVRELGLRIVVTPAIPGVTWQCVEVPPVLLDILAVVALCAGQAERALLEDRVPAVPQRQAEAEPLLDVAEAGQAVLAPSIGTGPGLVV